MVEHEKIRSIGARRKGAAAAPRMRAAVVGHAHKEIAPSIEARGFVIVEQNPDVVFSYGGDGTLMRAEYEFPEVMKVPLKKSEICKLCPPIGNEEILDRFKAGDYDIEELWKLEARAGAQELRAINEIMFHNSDPRHAVRYRLWINEREIGKTILGDGVVVATPFGSTGYYRSITRSFFDVGMGIAFNNSIEAFDHMVASDTSAVRVAVTRGPARVYADNQEQFLELGAGDELLIQKSPRAAVFARFV